MFWYECLKQFLPLFHSCLSVYRPLRTCIDFFWSVQLVGKRERMYDWQALNAVTGLSSFCSGWGKDASWGLSSKQRNRVSPGTANEECPRLSGQSVVLHPGYVPKSIRGQVPSNGIVYMTTVCSWVQRVCLPVIKKFCNKGRLILKVISSHELFICSGQ